MVECVSVPRQGDNEARLGAIVTPAMDRAKLDSAAKLQACFLEFVTLPLFQTWTLYSRETDTVTQLSQNIFGWKDMDGLGELTLVYAWRLRVHVSVCTCVSVSACVVCERGGASVRNPLFALAEMTVSASSIVVFRLS